MKVAHFTAFNASGMNRVAETCVASERAAGIDSHLIDVQTDRDWSVALDADIHVAHTHWPDFYNGTSFRRQLTKEPKIVTLFHGTPEFVFRDTMGAQRHNPKHGLGDGIMMLMHWLQKSDARITFWPRHQAIYQTMVDRGTKVHCIPLGVDRAFWQSGTPTEDFAGNPSVWTGENPHIIKDPLDLIMMWPWIYPQLEGASLHVNYLAENLHRAFAPLINRNDAGYGMHWSAFTFNHARLRNVFKSIDFFVGLVRYGDFNRLSLEAAAAGVRTISYRGNPFADYWITEGDQREMAGEMLAILRGDVDPRPSKREVPDAMETALHMELIYKDVLSTPSFNGFELPFSPCKVWPKTTVVVDTRSDEVKRSAAESTASTASTAAVSSFGRPEIISATPENAVSLRSEGKSYAVIAFALGVSRHAATKLVKEGYHLRRVQREKRSRVARPKRAGLTRVDVRDRAKMAKKSGRKTSGKTPRRPHR